jgi:hypothetical protein
VFNFRMRRFSVFDAAPENLRGPAMRVLEMG